MSYKLCSGDRMITSAEIIAALDPEVPLQLAHRVAVRELNERGMRYSYEDFDVLSAAWRSVGQTTVSDHCEAFVSSRVARAINADRTPIS